MAKEQRIDPNLLRMLTVRSLIRNRYMVIPDNRGKTRIVESIKPERRKCMAHGCTEYVILPGNRRCARCHEKEEKYGEMAKRTFTLQEKRS